MKSNIQRKGWLLPFGSVIAAAVIAVGVWFGMKALRSETAVPVKELQVVSLSMNVYSTLDGLTDAADTVVLGTVENIAASGISGGKEGDGGKYPYTIYGLAVIETFKGDASGTVYVVRTDPSFLGETPSLDDYPLTTLNVGETVILYLNSMSAEVVPESGLTGKLYVPLGFDNGVFDVSADRPIGSVGRVNDAVEFRPRGIHHGMFAAGEVFTAADIRQAIEP